MFRAELALNLYFISVHRNSEWGNKIRRRGGSRVVEHFKAWCSSWMIFLHSYVVQKDAQCPLGPLQTDYYFYTFIIPLVSYARSLPCFIARCPKYRDAETKQQGLLPTCCKSKKPRPGRKQSHKVTQTPRCATLNAQLQTLKRQNQRTSLVRTWQMLPFCDLYRPNLFGMFTTCDPSSLPLLQGWSHSRHLQ